MPNRVVQSIPCCRQQPCLPRVSSYFSTNIPGPAAAAIASSPMKKSKSSVPRLADRWPVGPAPPVRNEGFWATAGRPEPVVAPAAGPFVAIAVGKTNDGESLPAKPVAQQDEGGQRWVSGRTGTSGRHMSSWENSDGPSLEKPVPLRRWLATGHVMMPKMVVSRPWTAPRPGTVERVSM